MTTTQLLTLTQVAADTEHAGAIVMLDDLRALLLAYHAAAANGETRKLIAGLEIRELTPGLFPPDVCGVLFDPKNPKNAVFLRNARDDTPRIPPQTEPGLPWK